MPENIKTLLINVLKPLAVLIAAVLLWLNLPTSKPTLTLMMGETDGFEFVASTSEPASGEIPTPSPSSTIPTTLKYSAEEVVEVETVMPSFKGARVGKYPDALLPTMTITPGKKYWVDITGLTAGEYNVTILGQAVYIKVVPQKFVWPLPLYMEMQFAQIARAYNLADQGSTFPQRLSLAKYYANRLRAHGIEPMKHAVTVYPDTTFKNLNWNELVLDGRIAPPVLFGPAPTLPPSTALLQAIEAAIKAGTLPKDSLAYSWDEGEGNTLTTAQAVARVNAIRASAPSLKQFITRRPDPQFGNVIFIPVLNWFVPGAAIYTNMMSGFGLYISCMSNGNCQNKTSADQVAPATTFPMAVLDAPETDPQKFVEQSAAFGASMLLYFNTTQRMPTALDVGGQYNEGGNGDGTLLYPQGGVSRRLKFFRRGLNNVAWKKAGLTR